MKKIFLVVALAAFAAILLGISVDASANKYKKMRYQPPSQSSDVASAESNRSMMDCMEFSANFQSQGMRRDKAMFNKQYGAPSSEKGRTLAYNYDSYTNIILNCSRGNCYCKCLGK